MNTPTTKAWYNNLYKEWGLLVTQDWHFVDANGVHRIVPAGFWYNAGSIPALFWQLTYSPYDPILQPPTLPHDWGYLAHTMTKEVCDETLYMLLRDMNASAIKSSAIRSAVKLFGDRFYQRDARDLQYLSILRSEIVASGRKLADYGL